MGASDQQDSSFLSPKSSIVQSEGVGGRVKKSSKRKSRAVAKPPIRLLSADKSTFRDIVLHLTGIPSPPPPPPPPPSSPLSLLACAHTTIPSYPFSKTCASPFANHALHNSPLSFANPMNSQSDSLSFANPTMTPLSTSHISDAPPTTPSSDSALFHSSSYPLLHGDASSEISLSKTLLFLQALKQSLLQLKSLESLLQIKSLGACGSFNFGLLGQYNHEMNSNGGSNDMNSNGGSNDGIDGVDLEPLLRSQLDHTPKSINTSGECVAPVKSLDTEQMQNLRRVAAELESFLLTRDDKLDDLLTRKLIHNVNS